MATTIPHAFVAAAAPPKPATLAALGKVVAGAPINRAERMLVEERLEELAALDRALAKLTAGECLTANEAQLVKASIDPETVAKLEREVGAPWESLVVDSGADHGAVLAWLSGEGPDPCPP